MSHPFHTPQKNQCYQNVDLLLEFLHLDKEEDLGNNTHLKQKQIILEEETVEMQEVEEEREPQKKLHVKQEEGKTKSLIF